MMRSHGAAHLRKSECGRDETSIPPGRSMLVGPFQRRREREIDNVRYEGFFVITFIIHLQEWDEGDEKENNEPKRAGHVRIVAPLFSQLTI